MPKVTGGLFFADICKALGYKNPNHESKSRSGGKAQVRYRVKNTLAVCINRRGLLRFSLFANKRDAADFQKWADKEIFGKGADTQ
ncbi:MAG: BRO family protein [Oscillospiraceae bacterium]